MARAPIVRLAGIAVAALLLCQGATAAFVHGHASLAPPSATALSDVVGSGPDEPAHDPLACLACRLRAERDRHAVLCGGVVPLPSRALDLLDSGPEHARAESRRVGAGAPRAPPVRS